MGVAHRPFVCAANLGPYVPASQSAHVSLADASTALKRPAAHATHVEDAASFCHLPAGHAVHAAEPAAAENRPASQSAHVAASALVCIAGPKCPTAQGVPVHGRRPLLEYVPDRQAVEVVVAAAVACASTASTANPQRRHNGSLLQREGIMPAASATADRAHRAIGFVTAAASTCW